MTRLSETFKIATVANSIFVLAESETLPEIVSCAFKFKAKKKINNMEMFFFRSGECSLNITLYYQNYFTAITEISKCAPLGRADG